MTPKELAAFAGHCKASFEKRARWLEEFKAIRSEMGLTQAEMGDLLGTSRRGVQDIETGKTYIRKVHILAARHLRLLGDLP